MPFFPFGWSLDDAGQQALRDFVHASVLSKLVIKESEIFLGLFRAGLAHNALPTALVFLAAAASEAVIARLFRLEWL